MPNERTLMIVDPGLRLWGSERALAATLLALTEAWDRVVLVTPPGAELAVEVRAHQNRYGPIELVRAPIGMLHRRSRPARLSALVALGLLMVRLRPERVYLNQAGLARLVWPLCRALSLPLAVHVRLLEDIPRVTGLSGTPHSRLDLIFISDAMRAKAGTKQLPVGTGWHMAYDPYLQCQLLPNEPRAHTFVCVGRLSSGKGMHLLLEALARPELSEECVDIFGAGVEGDDYADQLAAQAKDMGGRVRMMGFHPDVRERLADYAFLVSTSHYESLGRVVIEGWEAGLIPIVYRHSGGAAEMVDKTQGGLVFDDWTAEALAPVLKQAKSLSQETRERMVSSGRDWIERELSLDVYRSALRGVLF